jgi:hypothetical protein
MQAGGIARDHTAVKEKLQPARIDWLRKGDGQSPVRRRLK